MRKRMEEYEKEIEVTRITKRRYIPPMTVKIVSPRAEISG